MPLLRFLALLGICLFSATQTLSAATPSRPNIIVVFIDDMGWMDSSVYGSTFYETPALERLAREGLRFTSAYAQPLCSPSRASLLTGQDAPSRLHLHQAITGDSVAEPVVPEKTRPDRIASWPQSRSHLPLERYTIAEALRDTGYQTWHLGKWHLGNEKQYGPQKQGFDKVIAAGGAGPAGGYFAPNKIPMLEPGPAGEYICERLTAEACQLMEKRDPKKPFFMYLAHFNVHSPYMAKPELVEYFRKKADAKNPQHNPVMAAMIRSMDDSLSAILDKLDALQLSANTLVIFTSDNGGVHWPNRAVGLDSPLPPTSNLPLRGGKACFYEGGIRVPMIARLPGRIKPATTSATPVHILDFYPTFLSYADATPKPGLILDGENLRAHFEQSAPLTRDTLYGHFPRATTLAQTMGGSWVRQGDLKLIRLWFAGPVGSHAHELYDLSKDIGEQHNLAEKMPGVVTSLSAKLDTWLAETGALLPIKNPNWNPASKATAGQQSSDE